MAHEQEQDVVRPRMDDVDRSQQHQAERIPGDPGPERLVFARLVVFGRPEALGLEAQEHEQHEEARGDEDPDRFLRSYLVHSENRQEGFLRYFDGSDALHALLALFLLLEQLALAGDVAAVALGEDVLPHRRDRSPGR